MLIFIRIQIRIRILGTTFGKSGSGAGIEVDPDLDTAKCSGSGWIRIQIQNTVYKFSLFEVQCVSKYFIKSLLHLIPVSVSIKKSLLLYKVIWSMWSCKACTIESAVLMQP